MLATEFPLDMKSQTVRLGMDLAIFCDMYVELKTTSIDAIFSF